MTLTFELVCVYTEDIRLERCDGVRGFLVGDGLAGRRGQAPSGLAWTLSFQKKWKNALNTLRPTINLHATPLADTNTHTLELHLFHTTGNPSSAKEVPSAARRGIYHIL